MWWTENLIHFGVTLTGLILLLVLLHLQERATSQYLAHRLGWKAVLFTGWIGVPLHELSHLFVAKLFGHRIIAWKLFDPDPVSGTLGYVRHAYGKRNPWQIAGGFFISIAPVIGGGIALALLLYWMVPVRITLPALTAITGFEEMAMTIRSLGHLTVTAIWEHRTPLLPLQLYLATCVAVHMAPSTADLKGALPGGILLTIILAGGSVLASHLGISLAGIEILLIILFLLTLTAGAIQGCYAAIVALIHRISYGPSRA